MSESTISIIASFDNIESAELIYNLISEGEKTISDASESGEGIFIHNFLEDIGKTMGIKFESWWIPIKIITYGSTLEMRLIGSPSGTKEQDIVAWLKLSGAKDVSFELLVHSGEYRKSN